MDAQLKDKAPLIIAAIVVVVAIIAYTRAGSNTTVGSQVVQPNNSSTDAANAQIAAANAASAQQYDSLIAGEFGQMVGFGTTIQNNITAVNEAQITANTQEQIAADQLKAQQTMYNDQLAAIQAQQHTQQQTSLWGDIFGTIGAIFGL